MVNKGDLVIDKRQYDNFVLLMPGAKVEMKMLPQLAVGLEANYRYFDRVVWEEAQFLDNKVSRPSLNLNVKYQIR
jgi:hypothetical protein